MSARDFFFKYIEHADYKTVSISTLYPIEKGVNGLENALDNIILEIEKGIDNGANIVILSDRGVSDSMAPIPILLACAHTHNSFKRLQKRSKFGIVIESAEPREPHHFFYF